MDTLAQAPPSPVKSFLRNKGRLNFLGLNLDEYIKVFFLGNAFVAVVVLGLITVFLFREGLGFFGQNLTNLRIYRQAGLEYVDFLRAQEKDHTALTRYLFDLRLRQLRHFTEVEKLSPAEAGAALAAYDRFSGGFDDAAEDLRGLASDLGDLAAALKERFKIADDQRAEIRALLAAGRPAEAAKVKVPEINPSVELQPLLDARPRYHEINAEFAKKIHAVLAAAPELPEAGLQARLVRFKQLATSYAAGFPAIETKVLTWDHRQPVRMSQAATSYLFGRRWLTASFWQDWYGVVPLLVGSLMVSFVALALAVPFGVGAALYVNQIATPLEQRLIKPFIEFISAIPSVVLGFFGIAMLGETLRTVSHWPWLSWVPGFPMSERLNILTAGCLLALMAVPTIFTLAEDALNNVPQAFKEASFALGANRLQTILKIIVPSSLSGIISAVLLGLGRVIGETMVVLLCAGNRIAIPDFTAGLAVFVQPVHTMTGIIAQEMGEVVNGSIHYRALFVVGITLFFLSLLINWLAQFVVRRYRLSIG